MSRSERPLVIIGLVQDVSAGSLQAQSEQLATQYPEYRFLFVAGGTFAIVVPEHAEHFATYQPLGEPLSVRRP